MSRQLRHIRAKALINAVPVSDRIATFPTVARLRRARPVMGTAGIIASSSQTGMGFYTSVVTIQTLLTELASVAAQSVHANCSAVHRNSGNIMNHVYGNALAFCLGLAVLLSAIMAGLAQQTLP